MGMKTMKNILVVNVNWIGDVIFSTPIFKALKEQYPNARIACMAVPGVIPVLKCCPYIDDIIMKAGDFCVYEGGSTAEKVFCFDDSDVALEFNKHLFSLTDSARDLGKSGLEWGVLWVDETAYIDKINSAECSFCKVSGSFNPKTSSHKLYDVGTSTNAYDDMNADNFFNRGPRDFSEDDTIDALKKIKFKPKTSNMSDSNKGELEYAGVYSSEADLSTFPVELTSYYSDIEDWDRYTNYTWVKNNVEFDDDIEERAKLLNKSYSEVEDEFIQEFIDDYKINAYNPYEVSQGELGFNLGDAIMFNIKNQQEFVKAGEPVDMGDNITALVGDVALYDHYVTNTTKDPATLTKVENFYNTLSTKTYQDMKDMVLTPEGKLSDNVLFDYERSEYGSYNLEAIGHTSRALQVLSMWKIAQLEDKQDQQLACWDLPTQQEIIQCMRNI